MKAADIQLSGGVLEIEGTSNADRIQITTHTDIQSHEETQLNFYTSRTGRVYGRYETVTITEEVTMIRATVADLQGNVLASEEFARSEIDKLFVKSYGGNDQIENHSVLDSRIEAGSGNDAVFGGGGRDEVFGSWGNDVIFGGSSLDRIYGGPGADLLHGGSGEDVIDGGNGDDQIFGGSGSDQLFGRNGDDLILGDNYWGSWEFDLIYEEYSFYFDADVGTDGDDHLYGNGGNDELYGDSGDDYLHGDIGADILKGGSGGDTLVAGSDTSVDILLGGTGSDKFYFHGEDMVKKMHNGDAFPGVLITGKSNVVAGQYKGYFYIKG